MKKRMLALLMALCLVVSLLPAQMVYAEGTENTEAVSEPAVEEVQSVEPQNAEVTQIALSLGQAMGTNIAADGEVMFTIADLAAGTYTLEVTAQGKLYCSVINDETVEHCFEGTFQDETTSYDVDLTAGSYFISVINDSSEVGAEVVVMLDLVSDREDGSGDDEGNVADTAIYLRAEDAVFHISKDGETYETYFSASASVQTGKTLADYGYTVSDPVYWDATRPFLGWMACTYEELPNGEGSVAVQIPGTEIMTSEEILSYPALPDYALEFIALWGGEDEDYFSNVNFDAYGGMYEVTYEYGDGETVSYEVDYDGYYFREGMTIQDNLLINFESAEFSKDPAQEGYTFEGWLEYIWFDDVWTLVSETIYSTEEMFARTVMGEDMIYVAKWAEKDMQEYYRYCQEGIDGPFFEIPEGVEVTTLTLDQKATVEGQSERYFSFTAPEDGYYDLCISNDISGVDALSNQGYLWINPNVCKLAVYLEKDEEFQFIPYMYDTTDLWISKANGITKLEILSQDTTKVFQKSNAVEAYDVIKGLTVCVTFQDGTSRTVTLPDEETFYMIDGYEAIVSFDFESVTGTTAEVTLSYGGASDTFQVKLLDKAVTQLEVLTENPIEVVENTKGYMSVGMNGHYFRYNPYQILSGEASFRFTWSDGSTETVTLTYGEDTTYYGVELYFVDAQDEENWTVGTTGTVDVWYGELNVPVSIKIVESPVEKLEIVSEPSVMLGEPDFEKANDGTWQWYNPDLSGLKFTITLKDQTTQTYAFSDWELVDYEYYAGDFVVTLDIEDDRPLYGITGPCDIPLILLVGGAKAEFNVHVVEKIVKEDAVTVSPSVVEDQLGQSGTVEVDGTSGTAGVPAINMPAASVEKVASANVDMKINLDSAQVTFSKEAVDTVAAKSGSEAEEIVLVVEHVAVTDLTAVQQAKIEQVVQQTQTGAAVALKAILTVDGESVADFDGSVTVKVPFTPPAGTKGEDFDVYFLSDDGQTVQKMPTTYADGYLTFVTDHFSDYVALNGEPEGSVDYTPAGSGEDSEGGSNSGSNGNSGGSTGGTTKPSEPVPDTGDHSNLIGYFTMLVISGMLAVAMFVLSKKVRV